MKTISEALRFPRVKIEIRELVKSIVLIIGFAVATAISAKIRVPLPFTPVPITLEVLIVLLAGAMIGSIRGALSQVLFLVFGIGGISVFASGVIGFAALFGPTGGYLIGFVVAAYTVGKWLPESSKVYQVWLTFAFASAIILLMGFAHLVLFHIHSAREAFLLGVAPFIPGDLVKVTLATGIFTVFRKFQVGARDENKQSNGSN